MIIGSGSSQKAPVITMGQGQHLIPGPHHAYTTTTVTASPVNASSITLNGTDGTKSVILQNAAAGKRCN